jgi:hypothetical protein
MRFCLAEAIACCDREFLRGAVLSLARDERHGRLLIRFTACSPELVVRTGVLWQKNQCPSTADSITRANIEGIEKFCTPFYGCPDMDRQKQPDYTLMQHIVKATEVMNVDSAANELLSVAIKQEDMSVHAYGQVYHLKNMVVARDKAHGARRTGDAHMQGG